MVVRSPGVRRPRVAPEHEDRVPPGQVVTRRWPVLHQGAIPPFDPLAWDFRLDGLVEAPLRFTWPEFRALPRVTVGGDLHCVTRWSVLGNTWQGIPARELMRRARVSPEARFVLLRGEGDYTANLPLDAFASDDVVLALARNGEPLSPEHGFPVRAIIPSRYAWKSVKWLRGISFLAEDRAGFWERYGYHDNADPWREERFAE